MSSNTEADQRTIEDNITFLKGMFAGIERIEYLLTLPQLNEVKAIMREIQAEHKALKKRSK